MSFKENLELKIRIDRLAENVISSMGPVESGRRIDKPLMRTLLDIAGYQSRTERGIEMYAPDFSDEKERILVLDNELKVYDTTIRDVELRKNPTTREMISFRNIRKILNDKDVVSSMGTDTVRDIRRQCLENLDLSYTPADIEDIRAEGIISLERKEPDAVMHTLDMFAELLDLLPPPVVLPSDLKVLGRPGKAGGEIVEYGPVYTYRRQDNRLEKYESILTATAVHKTDTYKELVYGKTEPDLSGNEVFDDLEQKVLALDRQTVPLAGF